MKYIDADKLKKSIGNYMEGAHAALNPIDGDADYYKGKIDACKDMQELVASLQQEQPEVDLEKEVTRFVSDDKILSRLVKYDDALLIARHFYKLGFDARKEE